MYVTKLSLANIIFLSVSQVDVIFWYRYFDKRKKVMGKISFLALCLSWKIILLRKTDMLFQFYLKRKGDKRVNYRGVYKIIKYNLWNIP